MTKCICGKMDCDIPFGTCHCGCGRKTNIARQTCVSIGHLRGEPIKFLLGHSMGQRRPDTRQFGNFKIDGVYCRLIALTMGQWAIVDECDYEWLNEHSWYAARIKGEAGFYAARHDTKRNGKTGAAIYMHRQILGAKRGDPLKSDHIDPLRPSENRRRNLRFATTAQNAHNMRAHKGSATGTKRVYFEKRRQKWVVYITAFGRTHFIGYFDSREKAQVAAIDAAKKYHGDFARVA